MKLCIFFKSLQTNCNRFKQIYIKPVLKQKINFIGKLEEDNGATTFFINKNPGEKLLDFYKFCKHHAKCKRKRL